MQNWHSKLSLLLNIAGVLFPMELHIGVVSQTSSSIFEKALKYKSNQKSIIILWLYTNSNAAIFADLKIAVTCTNLRNSPREIAYRHHYRIPYRGHTWIILCPRYHFYPWSSAFLKLWILPHDKHHNWFEFEDIVKVVCRFVGSYKVL